MSASRPPWSAFRSALDRVGFHPSRRLGQNFLLDDNLAEAIARDSGVGPGDFVLEVGSGCGFLTVHLLERGARVLAVEVDRRLAAVMAELLGERAGLATLRCDVLAGKHALAPEVEAGLPEQGDWHLVANLPYSVSAPLLALLARRANPPRSMTVLVQREVAERIVAEPGTPQWGPLGIHLGCRMRPSILRAVPPALFWPRPRVDSAVLRLELRDDRPDPEAAARLDALVDGLFQRRRKSLRAALSALLGDREQAAELLAARGLDPLARAEGLDLETLAGLAESPAWRRRH